jgi:prevent-host-death family protein
MQENTYTLCERSRSMQVSLSELKANPERYVALVDEEDIYITQNGLQVARLTSAKPDKTLSAKALFGILPGDSDLDTAREERLQDAAASSGP